MKKIQKKLVAGLFIMVLLTPFGIILPAGFRAGEAWGEWGSGKLAELLGYLPKGLQELSGIWNAPIADYNLGGENASMAVRILSYLASGIVGTLAAVLAVLLIFRFIVKNEE